MPSPYIGEIRLFAGNFPPNGWLFCEGQLLPISENNSLFLLIGTTYGGDGVSTFAIPDFRGRVPVHAGAGYVMGQAAGVTSVTLDVDQIPAHTHAVHATSASGGTTPANNVLASNATITPYINDNGSVPLNPSIVSAAGGSQPHPNMQPFLALNYIISLFGAFPTPT